MSLSNRFAYFVWFMMLASLLLGNRKNSIFSVTEAQLLSCLSSYTSCALGTFKLRDIQSTVLLGECACVQCLPGTFRNAAGMEVCEVCGGFDVYCPTTSGGKQTRGPGMCTSFKVPTTLAALNSMYQQYVGDEATVTRGASTVPVATYANQLFASYLWGNMQHLRNFQSTCGNLRFGDDSTDFTIEMEAPRPGTTTTPFILKNTGELPINFTFTPAAPFAFLYSSAFNLLDGVQVVGAGSSASFAVGIDASLVPSSLEWPDKTGFSFTIPIYPYQYWDQTTPRTYEPTLTLHFNVQYLSSNLFVVPSSVRFNIRSGESASTRVQLFNLSPGETTFTSTITYDVPGNAFLSAIPGGSLHGSGQCTDNVPVPVPIDEFSTILDVSADASDLSVGSYGAVITLSGIGSSITARVSLEVTPGIVDPNNYLLVANDMNLTTRSFYEVVIVPRDHLGAKTFDFGSSIPESILFTSRLTPLFEGCPECALNSTSSYVPLTGFRLYQSFAQPGMYQLDVLDSNDDHVEGSPQMLTVNAVNCKLRDMYSSYSTASSRCKCDEGYGEIQREDPFVYCMECEEGSYSSNGECITCPAGKYSGKRGANECLSCREREPAIISIPTDTLLPLKVGDSIELEQDAFDVVPNAEKKDCEKCPINYIADPGTGVCFPCPSETKTRKVVTEILSHNKTMTTVRWSYACVCKAQFFKEIGGQQCSPCPEGGFCLGKDRNSILPLEGYWKSPWTEPGANLEPCRSTKSCPGVYLDPTVLQQSDSYLFAQERAYLTELNSTVTSIRAEHGDCNVKFVCDVGFAGPLCNKCDISYTPVGINSCTKCIPQAAMVFVIVAGIVCALLVTAFIVNRTIRAAKEEMEYIGQSVKNFKLQNMGGSQTSVVLPASTSNKGSEEIILSKILISHMQEASMSISFRLDWPAFVAQMFDVFNIVSSAGQTLFSLSCLLTPTSGDAAELGGACLSNHSVADAGMFDPTRPQTFFVEAIFITTIPFAWAVTAGLFWYVYYWRYRIKYQEKRGRSSWNFFLLTLIVLVFLLYPTLSRTALRFFSCSAEISGYRFLEADFNIVCFGPSHARWMGTLGIFMLVVFAAGIPGGIFYTLWKNHRKISKYKPVFGFVFLGFKPNLYFWECVIMIRKLLFSVCAVIIGPLGSDVQAFCGLAILVVFIQLQTALNPYESAGMNRAEMLGLVVRFFTILLGLALDSENVSDEGATAFGALIIIINGLFLLYSAYIFYHIYHSIREHGILHVLGFSQKSKNGSFVAYSTNSRAASAMPQVHDLFPEQMNDENLQVVFGSERQMSTDGESSRDAVSSGNPVFRLEKSPSSSDRTNQPPQ